MSRRRKSNDTLPFDTIKLEGSLFVPELLERAARGEAGFQKETDYAIPKGLKLHDEYGRAFRIATASWQAFATQTGRTDLDAAAVTRSFVIDFLRQCLDYTDLAAQDQPVPLGDRGFPVTALAPGGRLPVIIAPHSLGLDDPDPRFAIAGSGSKKKSAHQLAQEFLNASQECLWAIVTNGKALRLLRDADTLTRPNFLEFDLETILHDDQQRYADFSALWRILHASRAGESASPTADCIWEKWKSEGHAQGLRVRDGLRDGVTQALLILGTGFLKSSENDSLRQRLQDGTLSKHDYFQQLLRLIYRCLFLFCAEERDLLHSPNSDAAARQFYTTGYSLRRFRQRSLRQSAYDPYGDLWDSLKIVFRSLATGQEKLALPALEGLFAISQCPDLDTAFLSNRDLLAAMRELRWFFDKKTSKRSAIDYRNMGPEELGSVYESLLELVPTVDLPARVFGFVGITDKGSTAGNTRKTTGSYYTPDSLVQELIKSALAPVLEQKIAERPERPIEALLSLKVCDPACGSGHFLLAAARRLAEKLAELRAPDGAVRPDDYRHALREVVNHCVYGVDLNPMAVELCKVALWLESVEPGKPLGFLDHHVQCGNSLLGATPRVLAGGLPDDAFKALPGDDKAFCANAKKQNKLERKIEGHGELFDRDDRPSPWHALPAAMLAVETMDDDTADALHRKEQRYVDLVQSDSYQNARFLADAWCAAFVWKKCPPADSGFDYAITNAVLHKIERNPHDCAPWMRDEIERLRDRHHFFHWHLAFPEIFPAPANGQPPTNEHTGWNGGFDVMLGNPPWERVKIQEKEWFATKVIEIADARNASERKRLISELQTTNPSLFLEFADELRVAAAESHCFRNSGVYPLCGGGDINTFALFAELSLSTLSEKGRSGIIVPPGIATDATYENFVRHIVKKRLAVSFINFTNRGYIFPSVESTFAFALLTLSSTRQEKCIMAAQLWSVSDLQDHNRTFVVSAETLELLNPNTFNFPIISSVRDFALVEQMYRSSPILIKESQPVTNVWECTFGTAFHMSNDSDKFKTEWDLEARADQLVGNRLVTADGRYVPLYESKLSHQFNHRHATFLFGDTSPSKYGTRARTESMDSSMLVSATQSPIPRYWVTEEDALTHLPDAWSHDWLLGYRRTINAVADARSVVAGILPKYGVGDSMFLLFAKGGALHACALVAMLDSFVFDYVARQKASGGNLSFYVVKQLPVVQPCYFDQPCSWANRELLSDWVKVRVLELTYTAWDLEPFARDCGWFGPPFMWDEARRFQLRCELDAAFFHLYGLSRDDTAYILDTFPIVRRKDEAAHGTYRTKDTILQIYDALAESMASGIAYQTRLSPVPTDPRIAHLPRLPDIPRTAFAAQDYFEIVLPLILSMAPEGLERARLFHAIELLTEPTKRTKAARNLGDEGIQWSQAFREPHKFADAGKALITEVTKGRIRGVNRMHLDPEAAVTTSNPWLCVDAFLALRMALEADVSVAQATEKTQQALVEQIIKFGKVA